MVLDIIENKEQEDDVVGRYTTISSVGSDVSAKYDQRLNWAIKVFEE
jgi:hypothetical protein